MAQVHRVVIMRRSGKNAFEMVSKSPWIVSVGAAKRLSAKLADCLSDGESVSVLAQEVPTGREAFAEWLNTYEKMAGESHNIQIPAEDSAEMSHPRLSESPNEGHGEYGFVPSDEELSMS